MKIDGIDAEITKLDIKDNDVLVFRTPALDFMDPNIFAGGVSDALAERGIKNVLILFLSPADSIDKLPEGEMNKAGWYRKTHGEIAGDAMRKVLNEVEENKSGKD